MRVSKQPEERRAVLIAAARKLFDAKGIGRTRVSDIVGAVGVAQGVFYYYFNSKDEIIEAVVREVSAELEAKTGAILLGTTVGFPRQLASFIDLYLSVIDQFTADDEVRLTGFALQEGGKPTMAGRMNNILTDCLQELVRQGVRRGEVTIEYPGETALVLLYGMLHSAGERLPTRWMVYTVAEQSLGLEKGSLTRYAGGSSGL